MEIWWKKKTHFLAEKLNYVFEIICKLQRRGQQFVGLIHVDPEYRSFVINTEK